MDYFKFAQELILRDGWAVRSDDIRQTISEGAVGRAVTSNNLGADLLFITDISASDEEHEKNIDTIKAIVTETDAPVITGGNIRRLEDVKKYLYAGAAMVFLNMNQDSNRKLIKEAADRFGKEKIALLAGKVTPEECEKWKEEGASLIVKAIWQESDRTLSLPVLYRGSVFNFETDYHENCYGYCYPALEETTSFYAQKAEAAEYGIPVLRYQPKLQFSELKTDDKGLIPVIVQDYKTDEVLMLAYMNEEAYLHTFESGRMTYYSRSREEQWEKGLTSGHFQYWKELKADCDKDTILAKVYQVGAACHTGSHSCFFNEIVKKDYTERNPYKVFDDVFQVILDRKKHPKEGSYTNYLFEKGIDKILKKCGEEATEIVIAAKNPNPEEIKYEISDFLYHMMVLMAEKNITWEDITTELARR